MIDGKRVLAIVPARAGVGSVTSQSGGQAGAGNVAAGSGSTAQSSCG